jgi:hypothetical protein
MNADYAAALYFSLQFWLVFFIGPLLLLCIGEWLLKRFWWKD